MALRKMKGLKRERREAAEEKAAHKKQVTALSPSASIFFARVESWMDASREWRRRRQPTAVVFGVRVGEGDWVTGLWRCTCVSLVAGRRWQAAEKAAAEAKAAGGDAGEPEVRRSGRAKKAKVSNE